MVRSYSTKTGTWFIMDLLLFQYTIDRLVYALYGLTDEEIAVVEEKR